MTVLLVVLAASAATFVGGFSALRFRDKLHLILGFSAGAVAGVAFFDLLPEAIELGATYHDPATIALFVAFGFFGYLILDRLVFLHAHDDPSTDSTTFTSRPLGAGESEKVVHNSLGALTLSAHSFIDGIAVGIGFQASAAVGAVITAAVLAHDFSDGINTVNLVLRGGGSRRRAFRWLCADAAAPALGAASTLIIGIPQSVIGLVLAVFAGSFLYLSASDLIPESHHSHPRALTTVMTLLGAAALYAITRAAGL